MKFIHVSDLHFHSSQKDNLKANALLKFIKEHYPKHQLIVTGDIADDGMEAQFENAFKALKPFRGNLYLCPGNHDFGAAGLFYSQEKAERFDRMLSLPLGQGGTFAHENRPLAHYLRDNSSEVLLVALDTNIETSQPFDFACGQTGKKQRKALKSLLESPSTKDAVKMVFMHHHPFIRNDPLMMLTDAKKLMRLLYYRVDVLLFGHRHMWESWTNLNGIPFVLASDNSPGKKCAREITVVGPKVTVKDVPIQ
jgi:3',5'-cyclic AMP phosphodiesterase CpdA